MPRGKRTPENLAKAMSMRSKGATYAEIGKELGVSQFSVRNWTQEGLLDKPRRKDKKRAKVRHETMEVPLTPESGTFSITGSASEIAKFLKAVQQ